VCLGRDLEWFDRDDRVDAGMLDVEIDFADHEQVPFCLEGRLNLGMMIGSS